MCVVGGRRSYTRLTWSSVDDTTISMRAESVVVEGSQHDRRSTKRRSPYVCSRWSPKLYKVNMIVGRWNGDLHACVAGGCRSYAKVNMISMVDETAIPMRAKSVVAERSTWCRSMKRRSPYGCSRWSPKLCKGQHDRRSMKRRSPWVRSRWSLKLCIIAVFEEQKIRYWKSPR